MKKGRKKPKDHMNRRELKKRVLELESRFTFLDVVDYLRDKEDGLDLIGKMFLSLSFNEPDDDDYEGDPSTHFDLRIPDLRSDFDQASMEDMPDAIFKDITESHEDLESRWARGVLKEVSYTLHYAPTMDLWIAWYSYGEVAGDDGSPGLVVYFHHGESDLTLVNYALFSSQYQMDSWLEL